MPHNAPSTPLDSLFTADFQKIPLGPFESLPSFLWSKSFFRINELTNAYVDLRAMEIVRQFEKRPPIPPDRAYALSWLERKLSRSRLSSGGEKPAEDRALESRGQILGEFPDLSPALDLIDFARDGYPDFLSGARTGNEILFDPARPMLWPDYFSNKNAVYAAGNMLAAHAAEDAAGSRFQNRRIRAIEVGAGCGSAAQLILESLAPRLESYVLTDISPAFLRKARERMDETVMSSAGRFSGKLEPKLLDIDKPADAWPARPGSADIVVAVNVLHAAKDLQAALRGLRSLLSAGGFLLLGECVRPEPRRPIHPEFIFQLLDGFRNVDLDPELRPEPGFLDAASWRASLWKAGFREARFYPDFDAAVSAYPEHSLAAIVAAP